MTKNKDKDNRLSPTTKGILQAMKGVSQKVKEEDKLLEDAIQGKRAEMFLKDAVGALTLLLIIEHTHPNVAKWLRKHSTYTDLKEKYPTTVIQVGRKMLDYMDEYFEEKATETNNQLKEEQLTTTNNQHEKE